MKVICKKCKRIVEEPKEVLIRDMKCIRCKAKTKRALCERCFKELKEMTGRKRRKWKKKKKLN